MSAEADKPKAATWTVTTEAKLHLLERELASAEERYPALVKAGHMIKNKADNRLLILQAIVADYKRALERRHAANKRV